MSGMRKEIELTVHMLVVFLCIFVIEWDFILFCLLTAVRASSSISQRVGPEPLAHLFKETGPSQILLDACSTAFPPPCVS